MFRTSYVHHQEEYIVHAALYGMFSLRVFEQSGRLEEVLLMMTIRCPKHVRRRQGGLN
jgi:hypothetical protein